KKINLTERLVIVLQLGMKPIGIIQFGFNFKYFVTPIDQYGIGNRSSDLELIEQNRIFHTILFEHKIIKKFIFINVLMAIMTFQQFISIANQFIKITGSRC